MGVVIERSRESERRPFPFQSDLDGKNQRFCFQARAVINRVVNYLARSIMRRGGRGALKGTNEAIGQWSRWFKTLAFVKTGFYQSHNMHESPLHDAAMFNWMLRFLTVDFFLTKYDTENCYYTKWRVWLVRSSVSHMKHHVKFANERVLTTIVEVLECGQRRMVCRSQYMVCFVWLFSWTSIATNFT